MSFLSSEPHTAWYSRQGGTSRWLQRVWCPPQWALFCSWGRLGWQWVVHDSLKKYRHTNSCAGVSTHKKDEKLLVDVHLYEKGRNCSIFFQNYELHHTTVFLFLYCVHSFKDCQYLLWLINISTFLPQRYDPLPDPLVFTIYWATCKFSVPWSPLTQLGSPCLSTTPLINKSNTVAALLLLLALIANT